ncbi:glycoside hydrolase family 18 protein [Facilibium subflavum]|uniref:hypothetical protein n=1 Tax=Facilibium subflavum TaxID=2219058 RepID=UPI000E658E9F|nr:hypothetical protein [Facilibium subflavum]
MDKIKSYILLSLFTLLLLSLSFKAQAFSIAKGNGIIVDDVTQDIICEKGLESCQSHLLNTLTSFYTTTGQHFYIFPDYANIIQLPTAKSLAIANTNCNANPFDFILNYSALPLIKPNILSLPELGKCLPGQFVTKFYQSTQTNGQIRHILPMFNGSAYAINSASVSTMGQLADAIAQAIINDPNASGVSFDLESPTLSVDAINYFIVPLAQKLMAKNKLVAIFDANLQALSNISEKLPNIIALVALYDYGLNPSSPFAPVPLQQYQDYTTDHAVKGYFGGYGKKIPVMFVTPAAATTTLWQALYWYNQNFVKGPNPELPYPKEKCSSNVFPQQVLDAFLILPPDAPQQTTALEYYQSQCSQYQNPGNASQLDYFNAALKAVSAYKQQTNFIGVALYNQKPNGFYALTCAKRGYSIYYTASLHKRCLGFYPEDISPAIWQALKVWDTP